jgi:hypothetical protein
MADDVNDVSGIAKADAHPTLQEYVESVGRLSLVGGLSLLK